MIRFSLPIVSLLLGMVSHAASAAVPEDGWIDLAPGPKLSGWIQRGGTAHYRFEDGAIVGTSVPNTGNSFLCTRRNFTNFVLELEFKVATNLNSGVQIRSECFDRTTEVETGGKTLRIPPGRVHGYQVEIDPSARAWTGGIYDEGRRGWLKNLLDNPTAQKAFRQSEWNRFRIEANGARIRTWLNDVPAADLVDELTSSGFLALQVHAVGSSQEPRDVRWRRLRIRELP